MSSGHVCEGVWEKCYRVVVSFPFPPICLPQSIPYTYTQSHSDTYYNENKKKLKRSRFVKPGYFTGSFVSSLIPEKHRINGHYYESC